MTRHSLVRGSRRKVGKARRSIGIRCRPCSEPLKLVIDAAYLSGSPVNHHARAKHAECDLDQGRHEKCRHGVSLSSAESDHNP